MTSAVKKEGEERGAGVFRGTCSGILSGGHVAEKGTCKQRLGAERVSLVAPGGKASAGDEGESLRRVIGGSKNRNLF